MPAAIDLSAFRSFVTHWQAGDCMNAWRYLGAHAHPGGALFSAWAPNANAVSVVGDFNGWRHGATPLHRDDASGIWRADVEGPRQGMHYAYSITGNGHYPTVKSDPFARETELRPGHASRIPAPNRWVWHDDAWMHRRACVAAGDQPLSIYEVHATSWRRDGQGAWLDYRSLAHQLVSHVLDCGFTHVEFMPLMEHWLDESWGYQVHAPFAPTRRLGTPDDLRYLIEVFHQNGIGVILDIVPGHFPADPDAWAEFDGQHLFEYADHRRGFHAGWGTRVHDYARAEVRSFLLSMACYWCEEFHVDGLRIDAVSSMLYRNYDRHDWEPNHLGGIEHFEAMDVLRQINDTLSACFPGVLLIAEESTAWPGVTAPVSGGGLGFGFKWNMGWMNDTLRYVSRNPVHRRFHHQELTFSRCYAFSERFILPLSHDEVVHGKRSLLGRMPGDDWQRFANLRLLYSWMFLHPGKKLLFMGAEWGVDGEWDVGGVLDWSLLDDQQHAGIRRVVTDLNRLYQTCPALHVAEGDAGCFDWIDADNADESVLAFWRHAPGSSLICVVNFTPVPRSHYRLPVTAACRELFNSDALEYGGSGAGNRGWVYPQERDSPDTGAGLVVMVPPLAALLLEPVTAGAT